jgi:hypothetical protein
VYGINEIIKPYFTDVNQRYRSEIADIDGMCGDIAKLL